MLACDETFGSSKRAFLVFDIRPIESYTKFQIICLNRTYFKQILKMLNTLTVLYHSLPVVFKCHH